ncbi:uncharacterized protein MYCFIDRAFT_212083, partial [Pseudocercospora fijiensis CIRAD86]
MLKLSFLLTLPASSASMRADEPCDHGYSQDAGDSGRRECILLLGHFKATDAALLLLARTFTAPNISFPIFCKAYPVPKGAWRADSRPSDQYISCARGEMAGGSTMKSHWLAKGLNLTLRMKNCCVYL